MLGTILEDPFFKEGSKSTLNQSIKGIGLKTAQRLVIELKDKVELFDKKDLDLSSEMYDIKKEALLALSVLGFNKQKSEKIVSKIYFENKEI